MADLTKGKNFGIFASERWCPGVHWIKQAGFGGRLVHVMSPRPSCHWIFVLLSHRQEGEEAEAPGRREEVLQEAAA